MRSINILLVIVLVGIVGTHSQPLKTTETSLSDREYSLPKTSESPLVEAQSKSHQGSEDLPIKVLANLGNNTIVTESSYVTLLKEIFPAHAFKADNSNFNETTFSEVIKEIFPPNAFASEDSTATSLESEDYEDTEEDEDPEGLGPRLSATLLKILTF